MRKFGFENEYGTTFDYGIRFLEYPSFRYGKEIIDSKVIPGKVGTLTMRTGKYEDTVITNTLEFQCGNLSDYESKLQDIIKWLSKTSKLKYTDSEDKFYRVKKVEISDTIRKYGYYGTFKVVFTCEAPTYLTDGEKAIFLPTLLYNPYSWCQPTYIITGEGYCTLNVNGKSMKANVSQDIIINTELMLAYHEDKSSQNAAVQGNYEDLYLQEGYNEISITDGFECKIIPNWRCL